MYLAPILVLPYYVDLAPYAESTQTLRQVIVGWTPALTPGVELVQSASTMKKLTTQNVYQPMRRTEHETLDPNKICRAAPPRLDSNCSFILHVELTTMYYMIII